MMLGVVSASSHRAVVRFSRNARDLSCLTNVVLKL